MKLLWTVSNWKHTGPVQPSLDLAAGTLHLGHDVRVVVGVAPTRFHPEADAMREERRIPPADLRLRLSKHAFWGRDIPDARRMAGWLRRERPDAVVTTLANDNRIALAASARAGGPPVVRLYFGDGESEIPERECAALLETAMVVAFAEPAAAKLVAAGVAEDRIQVLGAPLDVAGIVRLARSRTRLELPVGRFVVGIVARLQRHRRYEMLWDAAAELLRRGVDFHVLVLGRGTYIDEVGHGPVRARGLEERVTFGGYLKGPDYASAVAAMDAQLLLVPGSDPTCRALREGMALGVPSIATRRGLLPTIVADGETGLLIDETPDSLADAVERLACDRDGTRALGAAAGRRAREHYAAERVAEGLIRAIADAVTRA